MLGLVSLPSRLSVLGVLIALAFGAGWIGCARWQAGQHARAQLAQAESAAEAQRLASRNAARISDALTTDRLATERRAAAAEQRLRELAARVPSPAACPSRNDDPRPAAGVLRDADRDDLVALARQADATADRLRACQQRLTAGEM